MAFEQAIAFRFSTELRENNLQSLIFGLFVSCKNTIFEVVAGNLVVPNNNISTSVLTLLAYKLICSFEETCIKRPYWLIV